MKWSRLKLIDGGVLGASLVGLGDAVYLTTQHLTGQSVRCTIVTGCSAVLASRYAAIGGVPTAAYGAVAYFLVCSLAILILFAETKESRRLRLALCLLAGLMGGTTLWFLYLQMFVLRAYCSFCLLSAGTTLLILLLSVLGWRTVADEAAAPGSRG